MTFIKAASRFSRASVVDGRLYVATPESGLNVLEGNTLRPLPGTGPLGNEPFPIVLRYDARRLLVGTRQRRALPLRRRDAHAVPHRRGRDPQEHAVVPRHRAAGTHLRAHDDRCGPGHHRSAGQPVMRVNRANGLPSDVVYYAMPDREGALWLGLDTGASRVETPSPVSFFDQADGLGGIVTTANVSMGGCTSECRRAPRSSCPPLRWRDPGQIRANPGRRQPVLGLRNDGGPGGGPSAMPLACGDGLYDIQNVRAIPIKKTKDLTSVRIPLSSPGRTRPVSGWDCSTASRRSGTSMAAGSTKAGSRASAPRCEPCSRIPMARCGQARPAPGYCV